MLTILMGRAKTGKSEQVLRRIGELGDSSRQILLVVGQFLLFSLCSKRF